MAHQDVVPIAPGTEALWKKPPFDGVIEGGFVWGRGTLDDKSNVITQLEAAEALLKSPASSRAARSTSSSATTRKSAASKAW